MASNSDEDMYFEMEFDGKRMEEDDISFSSKSVESLSNHSTDFRDDRRGSSVGPILERPKYLR